MAYRATSPPPPAALSRSTSGTIAALSPTLDAIVIDFFTVFASLRAARTRLSSQLSEGFFSFARARHADPRLLLDSSSYTGRAMHNRVAIALDNSADGKSLRWTLHKDDSSPSTAAASSSASSSSIRQRVFTAHQSARDTKLDALVAQRGELTEEVEEGIDAALQQQQSEQPPAVDLSRSPLSWFGLLVPPELQQAQRQFSAALATVVEIAELEGRLRALETDYMRLLRIKDPIWADKAEMAARHWREDTEENERAEEDTEENEVKESKEGKLPGTQEDTEAEEAAERSADSAGVRRRAQDKGKSKADSSSGVMSALSALSLSRNST